MKIVVVIPCYNVSKHIEQVINTLPDFVNRVVAVNDCSKDQTADILAKLAKENSKLVAVNHEVNKGVGGAMLTGYDKAIELGADILVKMDGDGQMDPANMEALIEPIKEKKADFTKGNRFRDLGALRQMPIVRRVGNLGLSFLIKAASGYWNMFDPTNGYTAMNARTFQALNIDKIHKRYYFETSVLCELYYTGAVIEDVPMKAQYGVEESGLSSFQSLFEFPPKLFVAFLRRILLRYFLFDFNIGSVYFIWGIPLFVIGSWMGISNFFKYVNSGVAAPTGTVVIPTLLIILGFQLILAAVSVDLENYPKKK